MSGLYVHIPFCHSKCAYCDFYSSPRRDNMEAVVDGLIREYNFRINEIDPPVRTIYLGGGTPSILPHKLLSKLIESFPLGDAEEITIEANPEDVTADNVTFWRETGINRVSMGVQSLDDKILRSLGRRHSSRQALDAIQNLKSGGFTNISVDLIYGLPGLTDEAWSDCLGQILKQDITHLSAYCLTYHEGTALYRMWRQGKISPATDEQIESQFNILRRKSAEAGFEHYEISNFAKPGYRSRHNSSYWNPYSQWLGIGPSAHSFDGRIRRIDFENTEKWLSALPAPFQTDPETEVDLVNDNLVTALRTVEGIDLSTINSEYRECLIKDARKFVETGDMTLDLMTNRLAISPEKWLVSDSYIRSLLR